MILTHIYDVDISQPLLPTILQPMLVTGDELANRIGVRLHNGQQDYTPDGSCVGYVLRADGATVPILNGAVSGNLMYIDLPEAAYAIQGAVVISIVCVTGSSTTTVFLGTGTVNRSQSDVVIDPGTVIDDISTLIQQIETAVASIPADYSALLATIAPTFSSSANYTAGQYVWHSGVLYKFTADHAAGTWIGTDAAAAVIGRDLANLKSAFDYDHALTVNDRYVLKNTTKINITPVPAGESIVVRTINGENLSGNVIIYTYKADGTYVSNPSISAGSNSVTFSSAQVLGQLKLNTTPSTPLEAIHIAPATIQTRLDKDEPNLNGVIELANVMHNLVDYNYGNPADFPANASASDSNVIGIKRSGPHIVLNGTNTLGSAILVRLNGNVYRTFSNSTIDSWTNGITLKTGQAYRARVKRLSGSTSLNVSVYRTGEHNSVGSYTSDGEEFIRTFTAEAGKTYNIALYIANGWSYANDEYVVTLEEVTENIGFSLSDAEINYDRRINNAHDFIDYGYGTDKTVLSRVSGASDGTAVGVERFGTIVKLNFDGTSDSNNKRVRLSNGIARTSGDSTYKNWTNGLQLQEGVFYRVLLEKISGTSTIDGVADVPSIAVYDTSFESSLITILEHSENRYECFFVAPATPVFIAILLHGSNAVVLNDAVFSVTLFKDDKVRIPDYFEAEMADTIRKVQGLITGPSLVFLWVTDIHNWSSNSAGIRSFYPMVENMTRFAERIKVDFILNTGDLTDGDQDKTTTYWRARLCTKAFHSIGIPYLFANGNHDTNPYKSSGAYTFDLDEIFKSYLAATRCSGINVNENGTDYYVDFDWLNVRLIVLNANNTKTRDTYAFSPTAGTFLQAALDTDKQVFVAMHQSPIASQVYDNQGSFGGADDVVDVLTAYTNNGGNPIQLSGHSHADVAFISPWISLMCACQRFSNNGGTPSTEAHSITGYIDDVYFPGRTKFTASEDAWTVCVYNPLHAELSLVRFGAGYDRYFHVTPIAPGTVTTRLTGTVTWSSSDDSVATVSGGVITGVASGKCAILAKGEDGDYECWIVQVA